MCVSVQNKYVTFLYIPYNLFRSSIYIPTFMYKVYKFILYFNSYMASITFISRKTPILFLSFNAQTKKSKKKKRTTFIYY